MTASPLIYAPSKFENLKKFKFLHFDRKYVVSFETLFLSILIVWRPKVSIFVHTGTNELRLTSFNLKSTFNKIFLISEFNHRTLCKLRARTTNQLHFCWSSPSARFQPRAFGRLYFTSPKNTTTILSDWVSFSHKSRWYCKRYKRAVQCFL